MLLIFVINSKISNIFYYETYFFNIRPTKSLLSAFLILDLD